MQNVNNTRIVYTPAEIRHIGETSNPPPPKYLIPKCVQSVKTADTKPPTRKRTRRTKRGGTRKQRKIEVCYNVFDRNSHSYSVNKLPRSLSRSKTDSVSQNKVVNKNNLRAIDCRNVYCYETMHFRIACLNTHSCRNKTDDVQDLVKEHNIDLMCITESWLREENKGTNQS
ncbi:hypothetical protein ElyMa_002027600 [Elysia marginata]|uniref:Endonuclease/exonuclease/phosphatase domain-containing protein n=1 Tax=Elysia marginata TaxID=1093978 RepID=A0AAV4F8L7_9GAST|nr:hypothetical protein ElyMa_002027600 [Elysia marginata]